MMGLAVHGQAQTNSNQRKSAKKSAGTTKKTQSRTPSKNKVDTTNSRVNYKSERTKQGATITGQQATGTNGQQAPNPKNAGHTEE